MAEKWTTVQSSDEFQGLTPQEKVQVKQRYFDNVISQDADFQSLDDNQKEQTQQRFFATQSPPQSLEGTELGGSPATEEQREVIEKSEAIKQGNIRDQRLFNEADEMLAPNTKLNLTRLRASDTFSLLETVNRSGIFKNKLKRAQAVNELKRRGVPREFIQTFTELDDAKGFIAGLKEEAPETIGGLIGGGVGAFVGKGNPAVQRRAAAAGAGIGAGVAELGKELFNRKFRPERGRLLGDLTKDVAFTAGTEAIGDFVGSKFIEPAVGSLARKFAGSAIPGGSQISKELGEAGRQIARVQGDPLLGSEIPIATGVSRGLGPLTKKVSAELTPQQQSASRFISFLEGVTQEAFFGGGKLSRTKDIAQAAAFPKWVSNNVDDITRKLDVLSFDEVGVLVQDALHGSKKIDPTTGVGRRGSSGIFKSMKNQLFSDVRNKIPGEFDISSAQAIAQGILDQAKPGGRRGKLPAGTKESLESLVDTGSQKSISDLIFLRSDIGDLVRKAELTGEVKAESVLAGSVKELTDIMNRAAGEAGAKNELKIAMKFSGEGADRLRSNLIKKIATSKKTPPSKVVRAIFGSPGDESLAPLDAVRNVKDALLNIKGSSLAETDANEFAWDQLRFKWLTSNIDKASKGGHKKFGKTFDSILTNFGDDALGEMFSKQEIEGIRKIALGGQLVGKKARTVGSNLVRVAQLSGGGLSAASGKEGLALLALGGPAVLGEFLTSPLGRKMLTTGLSKGSTQTIGGIDGQFIAGMLRVKKNQAERAARIEKNEKEKRIRRKQQKALELGARDE